jgi:hypothetical protein
MNAAQASTQRARTRSRLPPPCTLLTNAVSTTVQPLEDRPDLVPQNLRSHRTDVLVADDAVCIDNEGLGTPYTP